MSLTPGNWQFVEDDDGRWRWINVDKARTPAKSAETFPTYLECALDAIRHAVEKRRDSASTS